MVLTAAKLPLHHLDLGVQEFDLGQQFFDLLVEISDPRPPPRSAVVLVRCGQLPPQSGPLGYVKRRDAQRQRINCVAPIAFSCQQVVRWGLQNPAEGEKQTEINSLLVAFDPREGRDADFGPARYVVERELSRRPGLAQAIPNHDVHANKCATSIVLQQVQISVYLHAAAVSCPHGRTLAGLRPTMCGRKWFIGILAGVFTTQVSAETLRLSLPDAIQHALHAGTTAALARSAEERARIARAEAFAELLPQADARIIRYNQSINLQTFGFSLPGLPPVVGPFNVTDAQLAAAMQLFNLAALRHYQSLSAGAQASSYAAQQAENDVAAAVARLYVLAQRAGTQVASRETDVDLFQRLLRVAKDEFQAGTGTRLDIAQATVQVDRARQALLIAQNDQRQAILALLNAMGSDEAADVTLIDPLPSTPAPAPVDAALATAREQRPELKEMLAREREASLGLAAARDRRLPSLGLDLLGDYSGNRTTDLLWTRRIAGMVGVPLFRADINADVARAKAKLHDAQIEAAQQQRDVEQDVRRAVMNLENAQARVAVATEGSQLAQEALTVARDRRSAGFGSAVEVDRAQDIYRQAREDLIAAQADAAAALFDLQHATGDIRRLVEGTR